MPTSLDGGGDLLDIYVQLASSRGAALPIHALRQRFGATVDRLLEIGAAYPGRPLLAITCPACHEDHAAEVIYEATRRRSWVFCSESGRVWIDDAKLATLNLDTNWLPDRLALALAVAPRPPRLTLIEHAAWLLGDIIVGSTKVSVALAVGIRTAAEIGRLIVGLHRRTVLDVGLLLVAGWQPPDYLTGVSRYTAVSLDELAELESGSMSVEPLRLGAWVKGLLRGHGRPINPVGRPSMATQVHHVFMARHDRGERYLSKQSEASGDPKRVAIRSEWRSMYPDEEPPGLSTIRKHLPDPDWLDATTSPISRQQSNV